MSEIQPKKEPQSLYERAKKEIRSSPIASSLVIVSVILQTLSALLNFFLLDIQKYPMLSFLQENIEINTTLLILALVSLAASSILLNRKHKKTHHYEGYQGLLWSVDLMKNKQFYVHRIPHCLTHREAWKKLGDEFHCQQCGQEVTTRIPRHFQLSFVEEVERIIFHKRENNEL